MINSTTQLNEIVRNFSEENASSSISQLRAIIQICIKAGIKFTFDANYEKTIHSFRKKNYPEFNLQKVIQEIESLTKQNKHQEAAILRDELNASKIEIHRQFRVEQYKTEEWFIPRSEKEIFFLPTQIAVLDSLIFENE